MMKNFDTISLTNALQMSKNRYSQFLLDEYFDDIQNRINNLISNETFKNLIDNATYNKEQSLIYRSEHKIIDLIIQKEAKTTIIDYKTTTEQKYSHITQVQNYIDAVKSINNLNDVDGYIIYLHHNSIEIIKV